MSASAQSPSSTKALVVDDSPDARAFLPAMLRRSGIAADACPGPAQAMDLLTAGGYGLAFIDVMHHGSPEGCRLIERLRADPRTARLPIIAMTGFTSDLLEDALAAKATGAVHKLDFYSEGVPLARRLLAERSPAVPVPARPDEVRVLVVEDDETVAALAASLLQEAFPGALSLESASTSRRARASVEKHAPSLILLDLHLSKEGDGLDLLRELKADPKTASIPVIVMTASEPSQAMRGCFDAGALDYVSKPLRPGELEARARRALGGAPLRWGPLHLDHGSRRAFLAGRPLDVCPKEFTVLRLLMKAPGQTVKAGELLQEAWGVPEGEAIKSHHRTLLVHMSTLRRKLGLHKRLIQNVRGIGYRLASPGQ